MITDFVGSQELSNSITKSSLFLSVEFSLLLIWYFIVPFSLNRHQIDGSSLLIERYRLRFLVEVLSRHFIPLQNGFKFRLLVHIFLLHSVVLFVGDGVVEEELSFLEFLTVDIVMVGIFFFVDGLLFLCAFFEERSEVVAGVLLEFFLHDLIKLCLECFVHQTTILYY